MRRLTFTLWQRSPDYFVQDRLLYWQPEEKPGASVLIRYFSTFFWLHFSFGECGNFDLKIPHRYPKISGFCDKTWNPSNKCGRRRPITENRQLWAKSLALKRLSLKTIKNVRVQYLSICFAVWASEHRVCRRRVRHSAPVGGRQKQTARSATSPRHYWRRGKKHILASWVTNSYTKVLHVIDVIRCQ